MKGWAASYYSFCALATSGCFYSTWTLSTAGEMKGLSQLVQRWFFLLDWILFSPWPWMAALWSFKWPAWPKDLPHSSQWKGLFFKCTVSTWRVNGSDGKITITNDKGRLSKEEIERMVNDAEKFKDEDNKQKDRISAKNGLESYCFNMKTTIDDEKMADKISADDKKLISDKCDDAIKWLDANQLAEVEEFTEKQKEVEAVCNPIITKLYQSAGGAPGGMPDMGGMGGMPEASGATSGGSGPTIEEVD